jgi:hypothetical protein
MNPIVHKCTATVWRSGASLGMFTVDLVFEDEEAWAVLEWNDTHDGPVPFIRVLLQSRWLQKMTTGDYVYQHPIYWPESGG